MPTIGETKAVRKVALAYEDFDVHHGTLAKLAHPTRAQAIWVARRIWRRAAGKAWPGTWVAGRGNHRTYPRGSRFLVNPGQGWAEIVHDMSHELYSRVCRENYRNGKHGRSLYFSFKVKQDFEFCGRPTGNWRTSHHNPSHALLERQMVAHAIELIAKL
jgi:hypothetical protein